MDLPAWWSRLLSRHPWIALVVGIVLAMAAVAGALTLLQDYFVPGIALVAVLMTPSDWAALGVILVSLGLLAALVRSVRRARGLGSHHETPQSGMVHPWRRGDALLRRYDDLAVDFDRPSQYDLGSWRSDRNWNEKYERYSHELDRFEEAVTSAPPLRYDEYDRICREIREVLSVEVQEPRGRGYYLALRRSGVMKRLRALVEEEKSAAQSATPLANPPQTKSGS